MYLQLTDAYVKHMVTFDLYFSCAAIWHDRLAVLNDTTNTNFTLRKKKLDRTSLQGPFALIMLSPIPLQLQCSERQLFTSINLFLKSVNATFENGKMLEKLNIWRHE